MVTRTCQTKRGVEMEIGSRRETVPDRLDPFWTRLADNLVPTKTVDLALGSRGIPRSRRALAAVGTVGGRLARKSWRASRAPGERREGLDGLLTRKKATPSGFELGCGLCDRMLASTPGKTMTGASVIRVARADLV